MKVLLVLMLMVFSACQAQTHTPEQAALERAQKLILEAEHQQKIVFPAQADWPEWLRSEYAQVRGSSNSEKVFFPEGVQAILLIPARRNGQPVVYFAELKEGGLSALSYKDTWSGDVGAGKTVNVL